MQFSLCIRVKIWFLLCLSTFSHHLVFFFFVVKHEEEQKRVAEEERKREVKTKTPLSSLSIHAFSLSLSLSHTGFYFNFSLSNKSSYSRKRKLPSAQIANAKKKRSVRSLHAKQKKSTHASSRHNCLLKNNRYGLTLTHILTYVPTHSYAWHRLAYAFLNAHICTHAKQSILLCIKCTCALIRTF